jgi:methylase of polypeptide subunit release factors
MSKQGRNTTNELEFQGQVLEWINVELRRRPGLGLDKATQEKPRKISGKRSDLVVWKDRAAEIAFLAIELKTPATPINDPTFFADAIEKAQHWNAPYFAIWNMSAAELYETPKDKLVTPADVLKRWPLLSGVTKLDDWLRADVSKELSAQAIDIVQAAWDHVQKGQDAGYKIDAEIFVARLSDSIRRLRTVIYREIVNQSKNNAKLRRSVNRIAVEQGFIGFVEDIEFAVAGQIGYRLVGQILFYFALRRKQPSLRPLKLPSKDSIPAALRTFWNDVRRFDYEALFRPDPIEELVAIPQDGQGLVHTLIDQLANYDWASLTDDVLGAVFERLIPREEQILLGQFYTPRPVADLLVALTADGSRPLILDPGCGSGTFLMSAYDYLAENSGMSHKDILPIVWGFDISPFSAELAAINLFRQDMSGFENFPRIVPGNFFDRQPGQSVEFPPPRVVAGTATKIPIPIPHFDCIVGNPPYLRSQNQDDLDPKYRDQLFGAAAKVGIKAEQKTDLFAFFIYHALRFMKVGSRLGFVTPASWLTADYAVALQRLLLDELRLTALVSSSAESFFPQVDVNTVLLVAERVEKSAPDKTVQLRFVNLKMPVAKIVEGKGKHSKRMVALADFIAEQTTSFEDERLRIKLVPLTEEKEALMGNPTIPRNWSKFMRAPLSYYKLFEDAV